MSISAPETLKGIIAISGDKTDIPLNASTAGAADFTLGFPPICSQPIAAGGIAPSRVDFNGLFNLLSQHTFWQQSGGMYAWSASLDYNTPSMVVGSNGKLYLALLASGPGGAGAKDPTTQPTYWLDYAASIAPSGPTVDEFFVGGGSMTASLTNGAQPGVVADATNGLTRSVMLFKGVVNDTSAEMDFRMPSNWDRGTVKAKMMWAPSTGASASNNVRFTLAGVAVSDGDALDVALGSTVTIDDTVIAVGDLHTTPASAAMTIAGTPQVGDLLRFKVSRVYNYGGSPMTVDAQVLGIVIQYGVSGAITAW